MAIVTSIVLIEKNDDLHLEPPPPWFKFPNVDPSPLGDLQGTIEYWRDALFAPFWKTLDNACRDDYLSRFPSTKDWSEFLLSRG